VIDGDGILVIAAIDGQREYALTMVPGQRQPMHAGAASKVLMASMTAQKLAERLGLPLPRYTSRTFTNAKKLAAELARIRKQGWAQDRGEYSPSVQAYAAPIRDRGGKVIAALSVPFLAGASTAHMEDVRRKTIAFANAIAADLPPARSG